VQASRGNGAGARLPSIAHAQAPLVEKNISMKIALMIVEGAMEQCTKDGYRVGVVSSGQCQMQHPRPSYRLIKAGT
jgi:hypothetical protein